MPNRIAGLARPGPRPAFAPSNTRPDIERIGPSYRVGVEPLALTFREVRTDRELSADVSVSYAGRHVVRTTTTLSLTARATLAKTTAKLLGMSGEESEALHRAVFDAVEAVLAAEEVMSGPVDLRTAPLTLPGGRMHLVRPLWPYGPLGLVAPGEGGKSTFARAVAVSIATGREVVPGLVPVGSPRPVLYVAGEDSVAAWHARSVEAICRGVGITREEMPERIDLHDTEGRPLHRIARALGERAHAYGAIVLDSLQTLLAQLDAAGGGIRDRDGLFWNAVDQLGCPTLILAHPNRVDSRNWREADGRLAGSEVNRDRARMLWMAQWSDEPPALGSGTSHRRYTLLNVKNSHGPREAPIGFAMTWRFGHGDDPGTVTFTAVDPQERPAPSPARLSVSLADALRAYNDGATTPAVLADRLGIKYDTAKSRLRLLRERGLLDPVTEAVTDR